MAEGTAVMDAACNVVPQSEWGIDVGNAHVDATSIAVVKSTPIVPCDASTKEAVDEHFPTKGDGADTASTEGVSIQEVLKRQVLGILDAIESALLEDRADALLHGERSADDLAVATCRRVGVRIAPWLFPSSGLKWAGFGEDGGGVSLVLRSLHTNRRLDLRISPDGQQLSAIGIDENQKLKAVPLSVDDRARLRERAAWVTGRV